MFRIVMIIYRTKEEMHHLELITLRKITSDGAVSFILVQMYVWYCIITHHSQPGVKNVSIEIGHKTSGGQIVESHKISRFIMLSCLMGIISVDQMILRHSLFAILSYAIIKHLVAPFLYYHTGDKPNKRWRDFNIVLINANNPRWWIGCKTVHGQDNSPTPILKTVHRQNWRQFVDTFEDSSSTNLFVFKDLKNDLFLYINRYKQCLWHFSS